MKGTFESAPTSKRKARLSLLGRKGISKIRDRFFIDSKISV